MRTTLAWKASEWIGEKRFRNDKFERCGKCEQAVRQNLKCGRMKCLGQPWTSASMQEHLGFLPKPDGKGSCCEPTMAAAENLASSDHAAGAVAFQPTPGAAAVTTGRNMS